MGLRHPHNPHQNFDPRQNIMGPRGVRKITPEDN